MPFTIVAANYNHHPDPEWAYEPYLEGVYRQKEFFDRLKTLAGGMAELTARPMLTQQLRKDAVPSLDPDGTPASGQKDTAAAATLPFGHELVPLYLQVSAALPQFYAQFTEEYRQSLPSTGQVEIGKASAPWTTLMSTRQANVGPAHLVKQQIDAFRWLGNFWLAWHRAHPEEKLIAFPTTEDKRPDRSRVIVVEGSKLDGFEIEASISPVSSLESITLVEHMTGLLAKGLVTEEEFQRARGEKSPHDFILNKEAEMIAQPYRQTYVRGKLAEIMGGQYILGPDNELMTADGQRVDPKMALQQAGYTQPQAPPAGGGVAPALPSMQPTLGAMADLSVPGEAAATGGLTH